MEPEKPSDIAVLWRVAKLIGGTRHLWMYLNPSTGAIQSAGRLPLAHGSEGCGKLSGMASGLREMIYSAAIDIEAGKARREVCAALVRGFAYAGQILRLRGNLFGPQRVNGTSPFGNGDDRLVAMGYLCETSASLIKGAVDLLAGDNPYAASALTRQLVEVEYLMWAFAEDREEASSWLRSTHEDRRKRWQPRHLRERSKGRFRGDDYGEHCEVGGHPTPKGVRTFFAGGEQTVTTTELLLVEVANHGISAWNYCAEAVNSYNERQGRILSSHLWTEELRNAVEEWNAVDHLPQFAQLASKGQ